MKAKTIILTLAALVVVFVGFELITSSTASSPTESPNTVEITVIGLQFQAPDEIPSGWTTFRLKNKSKMIHFAILQRMPEGRDIEDKQKEIAPVFQEGMDLLNEGEGDAAMEAFGKLPAWGQELVYMGGPGFISAGKTAETTVRLAPGTYLIECYVKTDGVFHSTDPSENVTGMVHEFTVTNAAATAGPPTPTLDLTISEADGIQGAGPVSSGTHTVAVHFADQFVHEHFIGHDIHLVRLQEGTDLEQLTTWLDWRQPTGLETPAPAEFLGGVNEMPAGETGYFTADLTPGRYAWIAEVPNADQKGMLKTFTVSDGSEMTDH